MSARRREPTTKAARIAKFARSIFTEATVRKCPCGSGVRVSALEPGHTAYRAAWNEGYAYGLAFLGRELLTEGRVELAYLRASQAFGRLRASASTQADAQRAQRKGYGSLRFEVLR